MRKNQLESTKLRMKRKIRQKKRSKMRKRSKKTLMIYQRRRKRI